VTAPKTPRAPKPEATRVVLPPRIVIPLARGRSTVGSMPATASAAAAAETLDRTRFTLAGAVLAAVAAGGAVVLLAVRRQLRDAAP
jgi:hypothetical protein